MGYTDLDFQFMIFQGNPKQDAIYYYLDGEKSRHSMKRDNFYQLVQHKTPEITGNPHEAASTYSFYLYSIPDKSITHLMPNPSEEAPMYPNNRATVVQSKITGKKIPYMIKEKKTIQELLVGYGFNTPSTSSIQNLQVSLEKKDSEKEGFLARFFNRRSKV